jgi:hypothetical protein
VAITVQDFPSLTDDIQSWFNEASSVSVAEMVGDQIFEVRETGRRTHDHLVLHGIGGIEEVTPGQDLPRVTSEEGDSITYTQRYFGAIGAVTKEMRMFDMYDEIENLVKTLAQDAFDKIDQSYADVLTNGWSTSYTDVYGKTVSGVGTDGLALFSASHTNNLNANTFSNLLVDSSNTVDPALSRDAIVASRARALTYKDPNNLNRKITLDTLIVSADKEDEANRIIFSGGVQGTPNVDTNPLRGWIRRVLVWSRVDTRSDGTDTSGYWFMADSRKVGETLKSKFAERPSMDAPEQVYSNKDWEWSIDFFYTCGLGFPAYIRGSRGTA